MLWKEQKQKHHFYKGHHKNFYYGSFQTCIIYKVERKNTSVPLHHLASMITNIDNIIDKQE